MPLQKRKTGRKYFKRGMRRRQYGKTGQKSTFRSIRPYGIKPDPFPRVLHTRVKYVDSFDVDGSPIQAGYTGSEKVYSLNSIYDPQFATGGTTVVGWSTFDAIYERYLVMGTKIEVTFSDPNQDGCVVYASLNQEALIQSKTDKQCMEQSLVYSSELNNTGSQKKTFNFYVKPWSMLGLSKLEWKANKSTHTSLMAASPADPIYLRLAMQGPLTGGTTPSIKCHIKIIYFTEFYHRKQLTST